VKQEIIRSACARWCNRRRPGRGSERGQALPIVLGALALGIMVVAPFLSHASASLISAQDYRQMLYEQYAADAGVEQAIWRLNEDGLASELADVGDTLTYKLTNTVNHISPEVTVTKTDALKKPQKNGKKPKKHGQDIFQIDCLAGSTTINAEILVENGEAQIESWEVKK
jgi:hypothetical protein